MGNIAIIPARGGSKRIPRKNIKPFLGKPVIEYSIEAAIKSGLFDEVMVSTNDDEIAGIAVNKGAKVPFIRSEKNSDDKASTIDVLKEVIDYYHESMNQNFEFGCCIYPAAPLIQPEQLREGFKKIMDENLDSVLPVVSFTYPVWRGMHMNQKNLVNFVWPEYINTRSQDLNPVYHDAGQWYWFGYEGLMNRDTIFTDKTGAIILDEELTQDIDNPSDWKLAEMKFLQNYG